MALDQSDSPKTEEKKLSLRSQTTIKESPGALGQPDSPPHAAARRQDGQGSADQGDLLNNINFDHFHEMIIKTVFK